MNLKKSKKNLQQHDSNIARAVDYAYKHPLESKSKIAYDMGASKLNGDCESRAKARIAQQLLSAAEVSAIVYWCLKMADKGFPVSVLMLRSMAIIVDSDPAPLDILLSPPELTGTTDSSQRILKSSSDIHNTWKSVVQRPQQV